LKKISFLGDEEADKPRRMAEETKDCFKLCDLMFGWLAFSSTMLQQVKNGKPFTLIKLDYYILTSHLSHRFSV